MARTSIDMTVERLTVFPSDLSLQRASDLADTAAFLPTSQVALDAALGGGLARARTHLLTSTRGAGAASLLHLLLAAVTPTAPVLLLDPYHRFFPPAALVAGVALHHLLLIRHREIHAIERTVATALRSGACPLVIWDAGVLPRFPLLDRLRPLVRVGQSAFLLVTGDHAPATSPADGATLAVSHDRWDHRPDRSACHTRTLTVSVTNHQRQRVTTVPVSLAFPEPLPPFLRCIGKGGEGDAGTSRGGTLDTGVAPASRRAG